MDINFREIKTYAYELAARSENEEVDINDLVKLTDLFDRLRQNGNAVTEGKQFLKLINQLDEKYKGTTALKISNIIRESFYKQFSVKLIHSRFDPNIDTKDRYKSVLKSLKLAKECYPNTQEIDSKIQEMEWNLFFYDKIVNHCPEAGRWFTGREQELMMLREAFQTDNWVAISGLGGIGKSTLAMKYGAEKLSQYQFVHFIPASTPDIAIDNLLKFAHELLIPWIDRDARLLLLKDVLEEKCDKGLLIFDGVNQMETFEELKKYLPKKNVDVLLTTRMSNQAKLCGFAVKDLKAFTEEEAVNFLLSITQSKEIEEAKILISKLGRHPQALTHAGFYIKTDGCSLETYIKDLNEFGMELFSSDMVSLRKDEKTILDVWNSDIELIKTLENGQLSIEILNMMAFLGKDSISLSRLEKSYQAVFSQEKSLEEFEVALQHLVNSSLIEQVFSTSYQINPLLQEVTRFHMPFEKNQLISNRIQVI